MKNSAKLVRRLFGVSVCAALLQPGLGETQNLPVLKSITAHAEVSATSDVLTYTYRVENSILSVGSVWNFAVDISLPPGAGTLSPQGLTNGPGFIEDKVTSLQEAVPTIPVGMQFPDGWLGGLAVDGTALWGAGETIAVIHPGQAIEGFQITSRGLPTIRSFGAKPFLPIEQLPVPPTGPEDWPRYLSDYRSLRDSVSFKGLTVAPTAPPADFKPLDFLHAIQTYKEQALTQGWIDNSGIANSLDAKINAAQNALQAGDNNTARNILSALVNEVDAQAGKHLTSEAVALLKFNALFLIGKIS